MATWTVKGLIGTGIVVGGLTIGTLAFTGTESLTKIGDYAKDFRDKITNLDLSLTSWKDAFASLSSDATSKIDTANQLLDEKNGLITTLRASIAELQEQIASGSGNEESLTAEIERLNSELTKANNEVASLLASVETINTEVKDKGVTVEQAPAYTLKPVTDNGTSTPPVEPTPDPEEPEEETPPVTPEGDKPVIDLDAWFTVDQQRGLVEMGIFVTDIGFHEHSNGTIKYIYIRTSPAYEAKVLNPTQQKFFTNTIVPIIHTKLGKPVDTLQIRILSNTADLEAADSENGFLAYRNPSGTLAQVN